MRDHVDDTYSTSAQQVVEKEFNTERLFVPDPHALRQLLRLPGARAANLLWSVPIWSPLGLADILNKNNSPAGACLVYNTLSLQKSASPILPSPIFDICQIKDDRMFWNCHHSYSIHWPPPGRVRPFQSAQELGSLGGEDKTHTDKRQNTHWRSKWWNTHWRSQMMKRPQMERVQSFLWRRSAGSEGRVCCRGKVG